MRADNTAHLIAAASRRHELARSKAIRAIRELDAAGATVTFESVASAAGVSRSWLYTQPDIRAEIQRLRDLGRRAPGTPVPAHHRTSDASLLRGCRPPPLATGNRPRTISGCATSSPRPSDSSARSASAQIAERNDNVSGNVTTMSAPVLATSSYDDPAAELHEDALARLREHLALPGRSISGQSSPCFQDGLRVTNWFSH
jgi:hypothetical protein